MKKIIASAFVIAMALGTAQDGYGFWKKAPINQEAYNEALVKSTEQINQLENIDDKIKTAMAKLKKASENLEATLADRNVQRNVLIHLDSNRLVTSKRGASISLPKEYEVSLKEITVIKKGLSDIITNLYSTNTNTANKAIEGLNKTLDNKKLIASAKNLLENCEPFDRAYLSNSLKALKDASKLVFDLQGSSPSIFIKILAGQVAAEARTMEAKVQQLEQKVDALVRFAQTTNSENWQAAQQPPQNP